MGNLGGEINEFWEIGKGKRYGNGKIAGSRNEKKRTQAVEKRFSWGGYRDGR